MGDILVNSGDTVSLAAKNWVAIPGKQTFLYSSKDLNWFGTDNSVDVSDPGQNIESIYLFKLVLCSGSGAISYKDRVNLESITNSFVQCGGGTCNSGNKASCNANDWQVFTVESPFNNTGNVKIGDTITLSQETGGKCSILPADDSKIFCGTTVNNNEYLQVYLPNGTDGRTAQEAQSVYNDNRSKLLKAQNPSQAGLEDLGSSLGGLFTLSNETKIAIALCICCVLLCSVMLVVFQVMF
jgi:hypothetical protein